MHNIFFLFHSSTLSQTSTCVSTSYSFPHVPCLISFKHNTCVFYACPALHVSQQHSIASLYTPLCIISFSACSPSHFIPAQYTHSMHLSSSACFPFHFIPAQYTHSMHLSFSACFPVVPYQNTLHVYPHNTLFCMFSVAFQFFKVHAVHLRLRICM